MTQFDYEILVRYMLLQGMLDAYEVIKVDEECTGKYDETNTEICILHIYIDERDLRDDVWHDLKSNGFIESHVFNDFPVCEHKVVLHVCRRR